MFRILMRWVFVFAVVAVQAQMPHEVLLLVNKNSQASLLAANTFAAARQVPQRNMVYLEIPESVYGGTATVTPEEFTKLIWEPANALALERGIDQQILAWVYSVDFPIRVKTHKSDRKQMSVGGLTFLRNQIPELSEVEEGKYLSRLFAGPNKEFNHSSPSFSLGLQKGGLGATAKVPEAVAWLKSGLGEQMPLPSMMLGYIGENGTDIQTVLDTIKLGVRSNHRGQGKGIYFVVSDDVRSTCRAWQYAPVVAELKQRGIEAVITTNFPAGAENVMGLMVGTESIDPASIGSFAPGAMAEHLTSWSAEFQKPQTKTTEWLKAGAVGSSGMVVEPYSNPNKFPSARFFVHYASGCTMLESFYQSIACPLQSLLLGDPLAKPYAPAVTVNVMGVERLTRDFTYLARATCSAKGANILYTYQLDGREVKAVSADSSFYLRIAELSDGYHDLRVIARVKYRVEFNASVEKGVVVDRMGRSIKVLLEIKRLGKNEHGIMVRVGGTERPETVRLFCGELLLDEKPYVDDIELVLDELMLGAGPNHIRAVAIYADGMEVSSKPSSFGIQSVQ